MFAKPAIIFALLAIASVTAVYHDHDIHDDNHILFDSEPDFAFIDIHFIKSITPRNVSIDYFLDLIEHEHVSWVMHELRNPGTTKESNNLSVCDKSLWLECGINVLNCTDTCHEGSLNDCVRCLGSLYHTCCGCLSELIHQNLPSCST